MTTVQRDWGLMTESRTYRLRLPWRYLLTGEPVNVDLRYDHRHPFKRKNRWATLVVSLLSRGIMVVLRARYRFRVEGDFPPGGCVAVSIHGSYIDGALPAALSSMVTPVVSTRCQASRVRTWFLENYGVIWAGPHAITAGAEIARTGRICWLAPQGFAASRHGTSFDRARLGAARMAMLENRPVVGIIFDHQGGLGRQRVRIRINSPLWAEPSESAREFTTRLMKTLGTDDDGATSARS